MKWYVLNKDGVATLCASEQNARDEAEVYDRIYPGAAPHIATGLVPASALDAARQCAERYLFLRKYGFSVWWTNTLRFSPGYSDGDAEEMDKAIDAELAAIEKEIDAAMNGANS